MDWTFGSHTLNTKITSFFCKKNNLISLISGLSGLNTSQMIANSRQIAALIRKYFFLAFFKKKLDFVLHTALI